MMIDAETMLRDLLCVIHRDGGQRIDAIGLKAAYDEAMDLSAKRAQWLGYTDRAKKREPLF